MRRRAALLSLCTIGTVMLAATAAAAGVMPGDVVPTVDGARLGLAWGLPFAALLLAIALVPLVSARFWHAHYGKVAAACALALLVPFALAFGLARTIEYVLHAILLEYLPFVIILFSLFTIAGGICVHGTLRGTPARNTALLAVGAALASVMGTTGAAMLLIRPLLSANEARKRKAHVVVFFIILVGNIGGALSPLGDPPLFIGFLKGVDFFWTTRHLAQPTVALVLAVLGIFFLYDRRLYRRESPPKMPSAPPRAIVLEGAINFVLIAGVIGAVLMSGLWRPGVQFDVLGTHVELQNLVRDALLIALALASLALTPRAIREHNQFHWAPIVEVAKLFAGIFVTIIPVIAILGAGRDGALAGVIDLVIDASGRPHDPMIFWTAGLLSAFLDNAPTYLVFFNLAGGDAARLMGPLQSSLAALSMGAVYFGALTYIGNAPNFMIKAIAEDRGVAMPSFFAYMAGAGVVLLPLFAVLSLAIA